MGAGMLSFFSESCKESKGSTQKMERSFIKNLTKSLSPALNLKGHTIKYRERKTAL